MSNVTKRPATGWHSSRSSLATLGIGIPCGAAPGLPTLHGTKSILMDTPTLMILTITYLGGIEYSKDDVRSTHIRFLDVLATLRFVFRLVGISAFQKHRSSNWCNNNVLQSARVVAIA